MFCTLLFDAISFQNVHNFGFTSLLKDIGRTYLSHLIEEGKYNDAAS